MSRWFAVAAVAGVAAGCGGKTELARVGVAEQGMRCPDPTLCDPTNGPGVYYQELGTAGFNLYGYRAYLTSFTNTGSGVTFQARYWRFNGNPGYWNWVSGPQSLTATYNGSNYSVLAIGTWGASSGNRVYFTLRDYYGNAVYVYDAAIANLALHVAFQDPYCSDPGCSWKSYTLTFGAPSYPSAPGGTRFTYAYNVSWVDDAVGGAPQQYCLGNAAGYGQSPIYTNDVGVFQSGFDVDPINGAVTSAGNDVTFSCFKGAPATVYSWGYDYSARPWHFQAAIKMKRASYCGDNTFYTIDGTRIHLEDADTSGASVQNDAYAQSGNLAKFDNNLESFWTPSGAECIDYFVAGWWNIDNRRHPEMGFSGQCNGRALPYCGTVEQHGVPYLADAIVNSYYP